MSVLGDNLKKYRISMKLMQEEVANKIHKTRETYSRYENGTLKPDIDTLIQLADIYSTSLDYLTGRASALDELAQYIPLGKLGQTIGDAINRKRISKRIQKEAREKKEPPSANTEGDE